MELILKQFKKYKVSLHDKRSYVVLLAYRTLNPKNKSSILFHYVWGKNSIILLFFKMSTIDFIDLRFIVYGTYLETIQEI